MSKANLKKEKWFLEQYNKGILTFDGKFFQNVSTGNTFKSVNSRGYIQISLLKHDEKGKSVVTIMAHRLIWIINHGLIYDTNLVINHIDGNKLNNNISNLELVTHRRNIRHALDNGLNVSLKSEQKPNAVFTNDQVIKFRKLYESGGISQQDIVKIVGCDKTTVSYMLSKKTYKNVK